MTKDKVQYVAASSSSIAVRPRDTIILSFLFSTTQCSGKSCRATWAFRKTASSQAAVWPLSLLVPVQLAAQSGDVAGTQKEGRLDGKI